MFTEKNQIENQMKNNQAFVICVQTKELGECYVGRNYIVVSKIKSAVFYHDELFAKSELNDIVREYKNTQNAFLNDDSKLSIKKVEINIIN